MPFVTPKGASSTSGAGATGRTTFRPPWVKDDAATSVKTNTTNPWAKKLAEKDKEKEKEKENGDKSVAKKPTTAAASKAAAETAKTTKPSEVKKSSVEPAKKLAEPAKKFTLPAKKTSEPAAAAPAKKPLATTTNAKSTPAAKTTTTASKFAKKKEPTPPPSSSSEEEETEEEETDDDEIDEDEIDADDFSFSDISEPVNQPFKDGPILKPVPKQPAKEKESESQRRFSIEKPKLRPVLRDKSMKKVEDEEEANNDDESEEDRERRLRFKLEKPKLRHVKREEKPLPSKSSENILKIRPTLKKVPKVDELLKEPKEEPKPEFKTKTLRKAPSINRDPSTKNVPAPPPLPSLVPKAPPPPPGAAGDQKTLSQTQKAVLDKLRSRPRRRPDWSEMMKEVESGRKLRHVQCNDRSQPILTCKSMTKVDNKFIYETEKGNSHNKLLQQIQGGIKLKPTKTNDRSKPFIEGLRKFRRQMTIEEQLQKSQSKINMLGEAPTGKDGGMSSGRPSLVPTLSGEESSADELDDIDKIRDDLQSTKQMLALELRNREAQERENKKLLQKIATLEAELEREKSREKNLEYGSNVIIATMDAQPHSEQLYLKSLKEEAESARKTAKELEKKYLDTGELLDQAKIEIEEQKRQIQMLERKVAQALQGDMTPNTPKKFNFCYAYEDVDDDDDDDDDGGDDFDTIFAGVNGITALNNHNNHKGGGSLNGSRRPSEINAGLDNASDLEIELSESDPDEPEEKKAERRERRVGKEVKVLHNKLTKLKVKQEAAKKEKQALKQAMKKNHVILKEENKKFKKLEKEVQKMAASMKEEAEEKDEDEDEEEEEEAAEEEAEEEESEESEESESEESEAETASESEAEDATNTAKKSNLEPRVKKHEGRLNALKKCNVLLQANVDNLQDEITQVRAKAANLQSELDAVLADLGF